MISVESQSNACLHPTKVLRRRAHSQLGQRTALTTSSHPERFMDHSSLSLPCSDLKYLSPPFFPAGPGVYSGVSTNPPPCAWETAAPCARHCFWRHRARCSFPKAGLRVPGAALQDSRWQRCSMFAAFPIHRTARSFSGFLQ